ncbi:nitrogen fixation protein NifU [Atopostipes suicloacalis DSM 15692]|uniref:Nitrogen fixation protein NifU n=1 Tax=Atopostipes suicloacalis DSM 15692 TaxID=1121025 RepID=A0A1M4URN7_9LACT|nr:SUF system NifU family Fe-S cluster assembly protein [Atopostipes suicloacalis]SHE59349.1 nitrogen fixation protein NifU [Atopostipes suicloacalis DSM 15692]
MRSKRLEMLYKTLIKEHSNNPSNKKSLADATGEIELFNPSCGDLIVVQFKLDGDILTEVCFEGQGCAISMASASMMSELMQGKTLNEVNNLIETFYQLVQGNEDIDTESLKDAVYLEGVSKFPTRIRCATLSWHALEQGLEEYE